MCSQPDLWKTLQKRAEVREKKNSRLQAIVLSWAMCCCIWWYFALREMKLKCGVLSPPCGILQWCQVSLFEQISSVSEQRAKFLLVLHFRLLHLDFWESQTSPGPLGTGSKTLVSSTSLFWGSARPNRVIC